MKGRVIKRERNSRKVVTDLFQRDREGLMQRGGWGGGERGEKLAVTNEMGIER